LEAAREIILNNFQNFDIISLWNESAFRSACYKGHLHVAQWLFSVKPDIDISACCEYAFRNASYNGHLHVAQWLLKIKPNIDIAFYNHVFSYNLLYGDSHFALWLLFLKPNIEVTLASDKSRNYFAKSFLLYCFYHKNINLYFLN
jgi:hypothetical protein